MSTATALPSASRRAPPREMRVYSHTGLLFWWPVWAAGFLMALWTLLENRHMALVSEGAEVQGRVLIAPFDTSPLLTPVHITASPTPGAVFVVTILVVLTFGSGWMRGWRAYTFTATVAAALLLIAWLDGWDELARWASYLRVHINVGGYLVLSGGLFLLWAAQVFVVDRRRYVVFSLSQVRVHNAVGEQEQAYDTGGLAFEKDQYDWFRRLVGFGAGDLRVRVGGDWVDVRNVVRVGRRLADIERLLRTKDVD
ncbi:MAG: hypothetical protein J2P46_01140 [Zavarzinella sp.]|nr:hypothetical protein [Zavarzinella sp.]